MEGCKTSKDPSTTLASTRGWNFRNLYRRNRWSGGYYRVVCLVQYTRLAMSRKALLYSYLMRSIKPDRGPRQSTNRGLSSRTGTELDRM